MKLNLDSIYTFPMDLAPNRFPFGAKSNGRVYIESKFGLDKQYSEKIYLCINIIDMDTGQISLFFSSYFEVFF